MKTLHISRDYKSAKEAHSRAVVFNPSAQIRYSDLRIINNDDEIWFVAADNPEMICGSRVSLVILEENVEMTKEEASIYVVATL